MAIITSPDKRFSWPAPTLAKDWKTALAKQKAFAITELFNADDYPDTDDMWEMAYRIHRHQSLILFEGAMISVSFTINRKWEARLSLAVLDAAHGATTAPHYGTIPEESFRLLRDLFFDAGGEVEEETSSAGTRFYAGTIAQ